MQTYSLHQVMLSCSDFLIFLIFLGSPVFLSLRRRCGGLSDTQPVISSDCWIEALSARSDQNREYGMEDMGVTVALG